MSNYIEMDNSARFQCLDRYIELTEKILKKDDAQTRYNGLSNLINDINLNIPDVIELCAPLYPEATNFRFNHFVTDVWLHAGIKDNEFLNCLFLLNHHRKDIEEYEADDEDKRKERNAKLEQYAQTVKIEMSNNEVHPDIIYCEKGIYRKYRRYYRTVCFRMGRLIQASDLVVGDLKTTMYLVLLYWALTNERTMVADELTLIGVAVPSNHRQMEWLNISELREAANGYLSLLRVGGFGNNQDTATTVCRLHDAIANVKVNEIGNVLARFNVHQHTIVFEVECIISIVEQLIDKIGMKMPTVKPFDPGVTEVFKFCKDLLSVMNIELTKMRNRYATDPTKSDEDAGQRLMSYLNGDYGDMEFWVFYNDYLINDLRRIPSDEYTQALCRRLNYLISICTDDEIKDMMIDWVDGIQHEIDTPEPPGNEQAAQPPLPPSAEATDTPDMALPDFSHMNSYKPTIAFDMFALYSFLVAEGVIDGIDEELFTNCITHAHINELWQKCGRLRKRNQLRCVINLLHTHHYKREWIESVARNLHTTPKKIYNPNRETLGDFEKKLRKII